VESPTPPQIMPGSELMDETAGARPNSIENKKLINAIIFSTDFF